MKINRRLLLEAWHSKTRLIIAIGMGFIGGILGILQASSLSWIIDHVFLQNGTLRSTILVILLLLSIILLRAGFQYISDVSAGSAAGEIVHNMRQSLLAHLYTLGPANLRAEQADAGTRSGELVNLATEGIDALEPYFSQYLPQVALAILIPLSILAIVFPTDPLSGFILLLTAPLLPLFMYLIGSAAETLTRKQWQGLSRISAYFLDVLQGLATLKSLGRSKEQVKIIEKVSEQYRQTTIGVLRITLLSSLALEMVATLSTAVVAVEIGIRLLYGRMAFEQAFFVLLLAPEFYSPLRLLGIRFHASMAGVEVSKSIFAIMDISTTTGEMPVKEATLLGIKASQPPEIEIKEVSFSFPGSSPVLEKLSFRIPAGKMTALTGDSGAGKTTLTWLLLRFLQPVSGEIYIDGHALSDIPLEKWYQELAWVPQNPYLFNGSIAANIKLARPEADQLELELAARLAHADEFIRELPEGYETQIGERGARLSAGQAQRIALARAFIKDARLIIMDEATSHLDPLTDALLQDSIQQLASERTVLVIAHRQSTLTNADQVINIRGGAIEPDQGIRSIDETGIPIASRTFPLVTEKPSGKPATVTVPPAGRPKEIARRRSTLSRLLSLLAPFWSKILLSAILGFATVASGIGLMATSAYIISAAALHPSIADLQVAIVGVRIFGITRGIFRYLERLASHDVTFRLLARWRVRFYQALEPLAPARLLEYHSGDLLARIIGDIGTLESFYVRTVNPPTVAVLVSAAVLLFMGGFGRALSWVLLVFLLLAGVVLPLITLSLSKRIGSSTIVERGKFNSLLIESIQGMPDLISNSRADSQLETINAYGKSLNTLRGKTMGVTSLQMSLGSLLASLGMLAVLVSAIFMVSNRQLDGVLLGVVAMTALTSFEALQPLPQVAQNLETNLAAADRLYELVDFPREVVDPPAPRKLPDNIHLEIRDLSFQYPAQDDGPVSITKAYFALRNISLDIPQGKHIGIIGPSGSGKTTLTNLLLRYWDYLDGSISLGGHEIHDYSQEDMRKIIAYASQEPYLFSASIRDNLLVARPEATLEDLKNAAQQAGLDNFIQSLPGGYNTWIGEHGLRLSAGERQRLALARVFLRSTPLLILDEPTANLDAKNERLILNSIRSFSHGKSLLYITQNMVGLKEMDEIIVLHDGQIVERGNHNKLLSNHGKYWHMWHLYHQIVK